MKMKLNIWQQISLVVSVAALVGFIITPIFAARADMDQYWKSRMARPQQHYKRNISNIRNMRNYSSADIAYEQQKLNARKELVLQEREKVGATMKQRLLKKYYAMGLMKWALFVMLFYAVGTLGPVLLRWTWDACAENFPSFVGKIRQASGRVRALAMEAG
ncbi:MAG: hypothetical protein EOM20_09420 [Spartobacteria bacterium]|nr:hypothetical protein [Spartobacteria bacterium]